ncbi:MAG: RNA polymerase factor sigma-54 [Lentisphaeria bacterium]|nr:RNA polymerase factor sigma-54 [Lentisphaeria bacterium]
MENSLAQNIRLQQKQSISPLQQQAAELLHLSRQELETRIDRELATNPLLEEDTAPPQENAGEETEPSRDDGARDDDAPSELDAERMIWGDDLPVSAASRDPDDDGDFWSGAPAPPPSMEEQLASEVATSGLDDRMKELASCIIDNLDARGFLASHPADLAMLCNADMEEMDRALALVRSFDPPGIAARDLSECLRLQLARKNALTPLMEKLTEKDSLDEIAANHLPRLAARLGVSMEELKKALAELKKLNPAPGSELAPQTLMPADPELEIVRRGDDYAVVSSGSRERSLFIPERYEKLLQDPNLSGSDRSYIEEKMRSARELIRALRLRGDTVSGIGKVLIRTQRDFLDRGPAALKPLTMKQAGEILGLHETTVSRAVAGKYVRTPRGIFPLRYFFSGGYKSSEGEDVASRAVQEKLRELVAQEDPRDPLSDDKLAKLLREEGLDVARRTIAKYRELLRIPSSRLRKQY